MEKPITLTKDQIAFAHNMSNRQADALRALAWGRPFFMSAPERGDLATYALIRVKLTKLAFVRHRDAAFFTWNAAPAGNASAKAFVQPALGLMPDGYDQKTVTILRGPVRKAAGPS